MLRLVSEKIGGNERNLNFKVPLQSINLSWGGFFFIIFGNLNNLKLKHKIRIDPSISFPFVLLLPVTERMVRHKYLRN